MLPTSVSQILEQIFNAIVSLLAAWLFIKNLSDGTPEQVAKWGAAGSTVGTTAGVVTALLFYDDGLRNEPERHPRQSKK